MLALSRTGVVATLLLASAIVVAFVTPANAHDQLLSTTPRAGSVSSTAPSTLIMRFSSSPLEGQAKVVAFDHTGAKVSLASATVNGSTVVVPWPTGQPPGTYQVAWRVVSADGHPENGTWTFSYGIPTPESITAPSTPAAPEPTTTSTTPATTEGGGPWELVALFALVAAGITIAGLVVWRLRVRRR